MAVGGSRVVFLTGSGLSADSGLRTFRGEDGLYAGIRGEKLLSWRTFRERPELVHNFMDDFRESLVGKLPNEAHRAVARVKAAGGDRVTVLTSNVDDLLEEAGAKDVVHVHGTATLLRSIGNSHVVAGIGRGQRYWSGPPESAPQQGYQFRCPLTNSRYRPDVVLFDEIAPLYPRMRRALRELRKGDLLVVIGTQGSVLPVSQFARETRATTVLNNLHPSDSIDPADFDLVLMGRAAERAAEIEALCLATLSQDADAQRAMVADIGTARAVAPNV